MPENVPAAATSPPGPQRPPLPAADERTLRLSPVPSPCTSVCRIDPQTNWCAGCRRTLQEIAEWSRLTDDQRRSVWARLPQRAQAETAMDAKG